MAEKPVADETLPPPEELADWEKELLATMRTKTCPICGEPRGNLDPCPHCGMKFEPST
ncbi:MAG TPA: hypothetical protein PKD27_10780 [Tepidiformaceae bacterium]|nr:hypothetical protein [Tepidiformaceae bacterium]